MLLVCCCRWSCSSYDHVALSKLILDACHSRSFDSRCIPKFIEVDYKIRLFIYFYLFLGLMHLIKSLIISNFHKSQKNKTGVTRKRTLVFYHLVDFALNQFKMCSLTCRSPVQEIIIYKNVLTCFKCLFSHILHFWFENKILIYDNLHM